MVDQGRVEIRSRDREGTWYTTSMCPGKFKRFMVGEIRKRVHQEWRPFYKRREKIESLRLNRKSQTRFREKETRVSKEDTRILYPL